MNSTELTNTIPLLYHIEELLKNQTSLPQKEVAEILRQVKIIHKMIGKKFLSEDHVNYTKVVTAINKCMSLCMILYIHHSDYLMNNQLCEVIRSLNFSECLTLSGKKDIIKAIIDIFNAKHYIQLSISFKENNSACITTSSHNLIEYQNKYILMLDNINSLSELTHAIELMHHALNQAASKAQNDERKKAKAIFEKYLSQCSSLELEYIKKYSHTFNAVKLFSSVKK